MENIKYMVRVSCITYNHAAYIEDAMNGFCMQETRFPFVCTIIDDASTDGEQEVIKNYIQAHFDTEGEGVARNEETSDYYLSFAQHKTNKNCFFAVLFLKYNHYSIKKPKTAYLSEWTGTKYVALCEGDDYWIDPLKLQKQVTFMETHPNHSLCFCAHQRLLPSGELTIERHYENDMEHCPMEDIILGGGGYMATNSMLYRQSLYVPYSTWAKHCPVGDAPLMLSLATKGSVGYLPELMCVYRVAARGSWSQRMASSIKTRRQHHRAIIKMWHQFDQWTERAYHRTVMKKIRINRRIRLKDELRGLLQILYTKP